MQEILLWVKVLRSSYFLFASGLLTDQLRSYVGAIECSFTEFMGSTEQGISIGDKGDR